jgi:hypothetical protein
MTREFHSNAQDHAAPAPDLELESAHDPEIARRTSLIGLEREANKRSLPPDMLGFAKKEGVTTKGTDAPAKSKPLPVSREATRTEGDSASFDGLDQSMVLVAKHMEQVGPRIDALTMKDLRNAGGGGMRALQIDAIYNDIDAQLSRLVSEAKNVKFDVKIAPSGLQMIERAYEGTFKHYIANAAARMETQGNPLNVNPASVKDHLDALKQTLHVDKVVARPVSPTSESGLVNLAIEFESRAVRTSAVAARNRLTAKASIDLEIERIAVAAGQVAKVIESHATNTKNNPDPDRRLQSEVAKENKEHLGLMLEELVALERALASHPDQRDKLATVKAHRSAMQKLSK